MVEFLKEIFLPRFSVLDLLVLAVYTVLMCLLNPDAALFWVLCIAGTGILLFLFYRLAQNFQIDLVRKAFSKFVLFIFLCMTLAFAVFDEYRMGLFRAGFFSTSPLAEVFVGFFSVWALVRTFVMLGVLHSRDEETGLFMLARHVDLLAPPKKALLIGGILSAGIFWFFNFVVLQNPVFGVPFVFLVSPVTKPIAKLVG